MKLSEKLRKLEEVGIDTSKFQIKCNGLKVTLNEDSDKNEGIDLSRIILDNIGEGQSVNVDVNKIHTAFVESCNIETNKVGAFILTSKCDDKEVLINTLRMVNSDDGYDKYIRHKLSYSYQFVWLEEMLKKMVNKEVNVYAYRYFITKELVLEMLHDCFKKCNYKTREKVRELAKQVANTFELKGFYEIIHELNQEVMKDTEIVYDEYKANVWLDIYRGLNGYQSLVTLAKCYDIGDLEELEERLNEYKERGCLWKFLRDLQKMDLTELYKEM